MGRSRHLLGLTASASAWALAASLACAQQAPGSPIPVTPSTPETTPFEETSPASTRAPTTPRTTEPVTYDDTSLGMSHPGEPMVDEDTHLTFPNRPLLVTGSTLFVLSYAPAVIFQAMEERNKDLYIPVAGPWMDFAKGDDGKLAKTLLAADGALQGVGALMMVSSLFLPERRTRNWYLIGSREDSFQVSPRMSRGGYGLFAHGAF